MKLPTKPTSGHIDVHEIRWLLYGPPKIGKTSLASGFPGAVFAACEKGWKALKVYKKDINSWKQWKSFVALILEGDHEFKTVVVDPVDKLFDLCSLHVCKRLGIEHEADAEWGKGWSEVKKEFTRTMNELFQSKYGIIFISHTKNDIITSQVKEITKMVPTLSKQARSILLPLVDTIGLIRYKTYKSKEKKGEYEERFIISFKGSESIEAGDRSGLLPTELRLDEIPEGTKKTPDIVEKYAHRNFKRIAKYYE
jgi:GTPase SAR1 family protein